MFTSSRSRVPAAAAVVLAAAVLAAPGASAAAPTAAQEVPPVAQPLQVPGVIFSEKCSASQIPQLPTRVAETATRNYFPGQTTMTVTLLGGRAGSIPLLGSFTVHWFNFATFRGGQSSASFTPNPLSGLTTAFTGLDTGTGPVGMSVVYDVSGAAAGGTPCSITPAFGVVQVG